MPLDEVLAVHHVEATSEVASPSAALDCCLAATCPSVVRRRCCRCRIHLALVTAPVSCAHPQGVNDILEAVSLPPLLAFASKNGAGGRVPGVLRSVSDGRCLLGSRACHSIESDRSRECADAPGGGAHHQAAGRQAVPVVPQGAGAADGGEAPVCPRPVHVLTCLACWGTELLRQTLPQRRAGSLAIAPARRLQRTASVPEFRCVLDVGWNPPGAALPGVQSGEGAAEWAASIGRAVDQVGPFLMGRMVGNWWEFMGNDGRNSWELVGLMGTGWS